MGAVGEGKRHAWAQGGDRRGRGVCWPRGPTPSELEEGGPGEGGGSRAPRWKRGLSVGPLLPSLAMGNIAITPPPAPHGSPFYSLLPGFPRSLGQRIRDLSYRVAVSYLP